MENFDQWLARLGPVLGLGALFYAWLTSRSTKNSQRLDKVEELQVQQTLLLEKIATELEHRPRQDSVTELKIEITRLTGTVKVLASEVGSVKSSVDLMDGWLRKGNS